MIIFVFIFLFCISTSHGAVSFGGCPKMMRTEDPNFNIANYAGIWYEIARVDNIFEKGLKCAKANYTTLMAIERSVFWQIEELELKTVGKTIETRKHVLRELPEEMIDDSIPNLLKVRFNPIMPEAPYWIVKTDFNSYALVVSCMDFFGTIKTQNAWLLSRTPMMNEETLKNSLRTLASIKIPTTNLILVDQVNC